MRATYFLFLLLLAAALGKPNRKRTNEIHERARDNKPACGYDSCPEVKPDMLNVHLVPHTHDDVGWLKTVDQYYFGSKSSIQKAGVQYILDSVIEQLMKDPNKRFVYVETAYFWKWWKRQHDTVRHQVKKLVSRGQLEFIGGAWSMNDEAVTHYQSIIDQFTWGLRKLNETFGECGRPRVGWQIDPFGHSREMASLFAQMGYDGLLFGRLDYQDKITRLKTRTAEMVWQGSANLGTASQLFTSVLFNNYAPPPGFCFDVLCDDAPIIDDKRSPEYNVPQKVAGLTFFAKEQASYYRTNNIIMTMGGDFTYMDASMWYKNMDVLIRHANAQQANGSSYNLMYSTPSCYLKAVHDENKNREWPVKTDDFLPYASDPNAYWTGFYTSRPTIKRFERLGNNFLQVCKQLYALTDLGPEDWADLNAMREAMGVMQHHDAVTGTEQQHVASDYARILSEGFKECEFAATTALNKIMTSKPNRHSTVPPAPSIPLQSCLLLNVSRCEVTESAKSFVVTLYNPLSRPVSQYVRVPVTGTSYTVTDANGSDLTVQLTPIPQSVLDIPGRGSEAKNELIFHTSDIPPLGFKSYYVMEVSAVDQLLEEYTGEGRYTLDNGNVQVFIDEDDGLLKKITINDEEVDLKQDFLWYEASVGNNREYKNRSSGAYIFRPNGTEPRRVSANVKTVTFKGPLTQEVHQYFNEWVSQVIRVYKQENYVEFEWLVGPIPVGDHVGKEIISRFSTNLKSDGTFYTDSNGREVLQRVRNYRPTWKLQLNELVAGNYYPVTSKISIREKQRGIEVAVLTDRAQGGTSLLDGDMELMVHRRLLHDDAFGVDEALNEKAYGTGLVARGQHYVTGGLYTKNSKPSIVAQEKDIAQRKLLSAWAFFSPTNLSYQQYKNSYVMMYAGLKRALPDNVQILTLEPWHASSLLLRLEHVMEKDDDSNLSQPVVVDLQNLFAPFTIRNLVETTLAANQLLKDNKRMDWKTGKNLEDFPQAKRSVIIERYNENSTLDNKIFKFEDRTDQDTYKYRVNENENRDDSLKFTLKPMQIRTFVLHITKS